MTSVKNVLSLSEQVSASVTVCPVKELGDFPTIFWFVGAAFLDWPATSGSVAIQLLFAPLPPPKDPTDPSETSSVLVSAPIMTGIWALAPSKKKPITVSPGLNLVLWA